jgi:hypothetical protein
MGSLSPSHHVIPCDHVRGTTWFSLPHSWRGIVVTRDVRLSAVNFSFPFEKSSLLHLIVLIFVWGNHDQKRTTPIAFGADPILGLVKVHFCNRSKCSQPCYSYLLQIVSCSLFATFWAEGNVLTLQCLFKNDLSSNSSETNA